MQWQVKTLGTFCFDARILPGVEFVATAPMFKSPERLVDAPSRSATFHVDRQRTHSAGVFVLWTLERWMTCQVRLAAWRPSS